MKNILHGSVPTAGFVAIKTIIDSHPKELFIKGFTFFKTQMNSQYRAISDGEFSFIIKNTHHNHNFEFNYIKNLYMNKSSNLKVDSKLKSLFENSY